LFYLVFKITEIKNIPNFPVMIPEDIVVTWNVKDPVGKSVEEFRKTRDKIILEVKKLIKILK